MWHVPIDVSVPMAKSTSENDVTDQFLTPEESGRLDDAPAPARPKGPAEVGPTSEERSIDELGAPGIDANVKDNIVLGLVLLACIGGGMLLSQLTSEPTEVERQRALVLGTAVGLGVGLILSPAAMYTFRFLRRRRRRKKIKLQQQAASQRERGE